MIINGIKQEVDDKNITDLLKTLNLSEDMVVVEVNGHIVEKALYQTFQLEQSHVVEIVSFIGGG